MLERLKESVARKIYGFLLYHGAKGPTMEETVSHLRASGLSIGEGVALYDVKLDGVYPWLISIGNHCILTGCEILAHDESGLLFNGRRQVGPVRIGDNVFVGRGALILCNVQIGNNVIVGAGSIVTRDIPDGSVVTGNPARVIASVYDVVQRKESTGTLIPYTFPSNVISWPENEKVEPMVRQWKASGYTDWTSPLIP